MKQEKIDDKQEGTDVKMVVASSIEAQTKPSKERVEVMSAIDYAILNGKPVNIAKAIVHLDAAYKQDRPKSYWDEIFLAFLSKPTSVNWQEFLKEYRRSK